MVIGWVASREALLVLDNCEHLLDGVVVLVERLLGGCSRLSVLTTSRARLLVLFEWVFLVLGLSVDADAGGDAVELFRVRAAAAGCPLTDGDTQRLAVICRGLDGMALAIELTAARVASLGIDGIEAGLADRLRLLTGGARVDDRHRSPRSALDWRYMLPDGAGQAGLRPASACAGPLRASRLRRCLVTCDGAWTLAPASSPGLVQTTPVPGGQRSTGSPTSCEARWAGQPAKPSSAPKRTGWRSCWPAWALPAARPASRSGGMSKPPTWPPTPGPQRRRCPPPRVPPGAEPSATMR